MVSTDFVPELDGFAFSNNWTFTDSQAQQARDRLKPLKLPAISAALGTLISLGGPGAVEATFAWPFLVAAFDSIVDHTIEGLIGSPVGLCAGMCYVALDYYRCNWIVPRGKYDGSGRPDTGSYPQPLDVDGGTLFTDWLQNQIFARLLDSHFANGLNYMKFDVAVNLLRMNRWAKDEAEAAMGKTNQYLAGGQPWPICLVARSDDPGKGHCVLAIGMEQIGPVTYQLRVYDPN